MMGALAVKQISVPGFTYLFTNSQVIWNRPLTSAMNALTRATTSCKPADPDFLFHVNSRSHSCSSLCAPPSPALGWGEWGGGTPSWLPPEASGGVSQTDPSPGLPSSALLAVLRPLLDENGPNYCPQPRGGDNTSPSPPALFSAWTGCQKAGRYQDGRLGGVGGSGALKHPLQPYPSRTVCIRLQTQHNNIRKHIYRKTGELSGTPVT